MITQAYLTIGLTRLDQQCKRTRTMTTDKKEEIKSPCGVYPAKGGVF